MAPEARVAVASWCPGTRVGVAHRAQSRGASSIVVRCTVRNWAVGDRIPELPGLNLGLFWDDFDMILE